MKLLIIATPHCASRQIEKLLRQKIVSFYIQKFKTEQNGELFQQEMLHES